MVFILRNWLSTVSHSEPVNFDCNKTILYYLPKNYTNISSILLLFFDKKQYIMLFFIEYSMLSSFLKLLLKASFEDIQYAIHCPEKYIIINTLPINEQSCLTTNTFPSRRRKTIE